MHKNIKQNNYSRYAANRDVISLFSGASPGIVLVQIISNRCGNGPHFILQFLIFDAYRGTGCNGTGDEGIGSNDRIPTDHRLSTQNGSACVNGNIVLNGGMAALAPQALASPGG